jgi:hypothetical protein
MYSSRRKSKRSYRKQVVSRKNKTRSKRKNLKFRKMSGGGEVTSYYNFIEEYEQAQNYIKKGIAPDRNTKNIQDLELNYPDFLETYKNDKANGTKSADRLTPEEEARIKARLAENETIQLQARAYNEAREQILAEPGYNPYDSTYRKRLDELSRNRYRKT